MNKDTASQSQAVPSELASLQRYAESRGAHGGGVHPHADGEYVKLSDVQSLFSHSAATGKVPERWISVFDAAPVQGEGVLVTDGTTVTAARWFSTGWATHSFDNDEVTYLPEGRVTHWKLIAASPAAPLAGKAEPTAIYQTMEGEFGEYWADTDKAGFDAANAEFINTRIVYTAPLAAAVPGEEASEVEYELHQNDEWVAGAVGKNAYSEIMHYAAQYGQDGPVEVFKVVRTKLTSTEEVAPAEPAPIQSSALTDERILELQVKNTPTHFWSTNGIDFARAIEREVLARLSKPAAQGTAQSIDTPEFRRTLIYCHYDVTSADKWGPLIAHIDRHIAAQATAGRDAEAGE